MISDGKLAARLLEKFQASPSSYRNEEDIWECDLWQGKGHYCFIAVGKMLNAQTFPQNKILNETLEVALLAIINFAG